MITRKAHSYLDVKENPKRGRYRKQTYRKKQHYQESWKQKYCKMRNTIESTNARFKHRFGEYIPGKNIHNRRRYLAIRVFALNLISLQKSCKKSPISFVLLSRISTRPELHLLKIKKLYLIIFQNVFIHNLLNFK